MSSFCNANAKATHIFFSKNMSLNAIVNDQCFNDTLTSDSIIFEQLGPEDFAAIIQRETIFADRNLTVCMLGKKLKIPADNILKYFSYFSLKVAFNISCTICIKFLILLSRKNIKKFKMSSA